MAGKQAKILSVSQIDDLLFFAECSRHPLRNRVVVLLSIKAGLRAAEISQLTCQMVLDPAGEVAGSIELRDSAAKMGGGRIIPMHEQLRQAAINYHRTTKGQDSVILSERGRPMAPLS